MFQNLALTSELSAMLSSRSALHADGHTLWYFILALKRDQFSMTVILLSDLSRDTLSCG